MCAKSPISVSATRAAHHGRHLVGRCRGYGPPHRLHQRELVSIGKLDGKIAIITGASKGIGAGIARVFTEEGACVVLAARGNVEATTSCSSPRSCRQLAGSGRLSLQRERCPVLQEPCRLHPQDVRDNRHSRLQRRHLHAQRLPYQRRRVARCTYRHQHQGCLERLPRGPAHHGAQQRRVRRHHQLGHGRHGGRSR